MDQYDTIILQDENTDSLSEKVVEKQKEGYIPFGFQAVFMPGARFINFFIAMYKEEIDWDELEKEEDDTSDK
jgi:hypothetical protein